MDIDILKLIGEASSYDKKEMVELKRPKSWLKSVSAFANGEGGVLIFGVTDDDVVVGLAHAEEDGEAISENVKTKRNTCKTLCQLGKQKPDSSDPQRTNVPVPLAL